MPGRHQPAPEAAARRRPPARLHTWPHTLARPAPSTRARVCRPRRPSVPPPPSARGAARRRGVAAGPGARGDAPQRVPVGPHRPRPQPPEGAAAAAAVRARVIGLNLGLACPARGRRGRARALPRRRGAGGWVGPSAQPQRPPRGRRGQRVRYAPQRTAPARPAPRTEPVRVLHPPGRRPGGREQAAAVLGDRHGAPPSRGCWSGMAPTKAPRSFVTRPTASSLRPPSVATRCLPPPALKPQTSSHSIPPSPTRAPPGHV
jgi:hypothetical protein